MLPYARTMPIWAELKLPGYLKSVFPKDNSS